ncbi:MAG: putative toxin-antitoxin system toxin component, PIN family [Burkholderiaceae bacterium]|nr:putative toxin-antitoxin system toxin component, PIN family [Burkholderiaceae bacterium]
MSYARRHFVFDTSSLIGAVLQPAGRPKQALLLAMSLGRLVASRETVFELVEVLKREKFDPLIGKAARAAFLEAYLSSIRLVATPAAVQECRDPGDDKFLALAAAARAVAIVASDEDLRVLHPWRGIDVLSPTQFLETAPGRWSAH